ncbi:hypothetical protein DKX38_002530 [Salix brachista]|uniref:Glycosyltransferase 61 catalytic domain-containing protein n=1 Tax=Salix brachista TaxID=2182728 RepID=A0A5N5NNX0_9ROSI|nr:hypothetical protein DKX38_002530 [Salix brachista]
MDVEKTSRAFTTRKSSCYSKKIITAIFLLLLIPKLAHLQASPFYFFASPTATSRAFFNKWKGIALDDASAGPSISKNSDSLISKLRESVTFLPLKDLRFAETAMEGSTWFMSSLNDTHEANEAEYLYFPSQMSKGRILCIKGRHASDGTKNSYALVWPEALPRLCHAHEGLDLRVHTYYDYGNLWHGLTGMAPFVGWSMKNNCLNPTRWVLFHWGELRTKTGSWLQHLMQAHFGEVKIEGFEGEDGPYCFEKAVVMRHNEGSMGKERKLQVFDLLRCNARRFCGISPAGKGQETNERGEPIIRLTLLMRRGSRSFKNAAAVTDIFARECAKVEGCSFKVAQSENLSFCDQVRVMTYTNVVASPHGAQLTNMLFMDRNSSVMEFFPKGWLELAGVGQYAHHWMADQSGMNHRGAWWDPLDKTECPFPQQDLDCFNFYKDGKVGHNKTHFAEWARIVLDQVKISKMQIATRSPTNEPQPNSNACKC